MSFNTIENNERLEKGLKQALVNQITEFNNISGGQSIAVFSDPIDEFTGGRIRLFQQAIFDESGIYPEVVKMIPACLKVFFTLEASREYTKKTLIPYFSTQRYNELCDEVGLSYVQFYGTIFHPSMK